MRLFADENFPRPAVAALREAGFDLLWIAETHPGAPDEVAPLALTAIRSQPTWASRFSVVTQQKIRARPLPPARD